MRRVVEATSKRRQQPAGSIEKAGGRAAAVGLGCQGRRRDRGQGIEGTVPAAIETYIEGLKAHDVAKVATTVADDLAFVTPARTMGKAQFLAFLRALYAGFPDWHYDHDPPQARADGAIAVRWRQGGTHTATLALPGFEPVPATGRTVTIPEQDFFYRVSNDRIVEIRPDPVPGGAPRGIFEQIGVTLPPL